MSVTLLVILIWNSVLKMPLITNDLWPRYRDQNDKLGCLRVDRAFRDGNYGSRRRVLWINGGVMYSWMLDIEETVWILLQEWTGVEATLGWGMA